MMKFPLLGAFAAVILSFAAATAYSQYRAAAIDEAASGIAQDTSPSIQHLAAARIDLHRVLVAARDEAAASPEERAEPAQSLAEARAALASETKAYLALPVSAGEQQMGRDIQQAVAAVDAVLRDLTASVEVGRGDEAQRLVARGLPRAFDRASDSLMRAIDFNAGRARDLALRIERVRERSTRIAWGLDLLSGALAVLAASLVWRELKRSTELAQAHLRLTEGRAAELEQFAGRVAHDIVDPIGSAALGVDLARRFLGQNERATQALVSARMSLTRTSRIVEGLLEFARAGARPTPDASADVGSVTEDLALELRPAAGEVGAELRFEPFAPCAVACSPGCVTSLVSNLVRNAIKYIGDGPVRCITVRVLQRGGRVRVEVEDTGPGLPPGLAASVFDPYVRAPGTGKPGIGLGLATVRRIAEAHGGAVGVRSSPGAGCLFWFELPQTELRAESPVVASAGGTAAGRLSYQDRSN